MAEGGGVGQLGHAPGLDHRQPQGLEELHHIGVERRRAARRQPARVQAGEGEQGLAGRCRPLGCGRQRCGHLLAPLPAPHDLPAGLDRRLDRLAALRVGLGREPGQQGAVQLLPDPK